MRLTIKNNTIWLSLVMLTMLSACSSYKNIPYFQDSPNNRDLKENITNFSLFIIQPGDNLGINVTSPNSDANQLYNFRTNGTTEISPDNAITGFLVDETGAIQLPLVGEVKAAGLTTTQLRAKLKPLLAKYYRDPVVSIRVLNFKITVLGDVQKPGIYRIENERVTLTQALALAGDLNITALRNIKLIREQNGERLVTNIDLTKKETFSAATYYLKNNDEIFVQADRTKYATVDRGYRTATLILSGLSIIAIVLSNLYR